MSLPVRDLERSRAFFEGALAPLGAAVQMEYEGGCGIGLPGQPALWLHQGEPPPSLHLAFVAPDRTAVDAFYQAALARGGRDNGPPGLRAQYAPDYYAAFVFDPDGHNLEAVCHEAAAAAQARGARRRGARTASKAARGKGRAKGKASGRGTTRSARKPSRRTRKAARRR